MEKWLEKKQISIESIGAIFIILFASLFIMANFIIGFVWPLFIIFVLVGFVLSVAYPRSGVLAIVFLTMIWERFFTLQTFFIGKVEYKIYPLDWILAGIFLSIIGQYIFLKRKIIIRLEDKMLAAFFLLNGLYFLFSLFVLKSNAQLAFSAFRNYAFYGCLYFVVIFLFRDQKDWKKIFSFFLAGAVGIIFFIVWGFFFGEGLWSGYTPLSTGGVRKLAFTHGLYLTLAFFPSVLYLIFRNVNRKSTSAMGWYILLSIWMLGIIGTLMRHLWIALLGVLVSLWIFLPNEKRKLFIKTITKLAAPLVIAGIFIFYVVVMNPQSTFSRQLEKTLGFVSTRAISVVNSDEDESFSWRNLVWKSAYERFQGNPFLGIGTGEKIYVEKENYRDFIEGRNIHNSYLAILIQLGLVGIGLFLTGVYVNIKKLFFSQGNDEYLFYKFSVLSVIAIYILAMPFQPYLETNLLAIFFWMSLGLSRILPEIKKIIL